MIAPEKNRLIRETLQRLATSHATAVAQFEEVIAVLSNVLEIDELEVDHAARPTANHQSTRSLEPDLPVADRTTFTIIWRRRTCFLGNSMQSMAAYQGTTV